VTKEERTLFKVLVVEDEILSATDIVDMIRSFGYSTLGPIATGEDALVFAGRDKPDIILMDIHLRGDIDGIAAATEIRIKHKIPVVYITAHSDIDTLDRVKITEPYGYIMKPFGERDIYLTLELAIGKIESEKKFAKREEWYSTILSSIDDGVIAANSDGKITYMNTAAEMMTGYGFFEAHNKQLKNIFNVTNTSIGDKKEKSEKGVFDFEGNGISLFMKNNVLVAKNGSKISVDYSASTIEHHSDMSAGGVIVFRDITERQEAQEAFQNTFIQLRRAMAGTIKAMALTVETRDPYTAGHQRRVADLATAIAEVMGIDREIIDGIQMAAAIHDLGKISVPAEILSKPGKLSEAEFNLIKIHPQSGYDILKNIEFPWPIADIIYQHHERLDGSGYPNRLMKRDIKIEARIIAVADVVEAMASHRPYRPSLGLDVALKEVIEKKGIFYDAKVVDACEFIIKEKGFVF
jgi:PAS domain S-box-containing protein